MQLATRAVVTAVLAAVVAVAGFLGNLPLTVAVGLLAVVFAVGWPALAGLPFKPGSTVVVGLGGLAAVVTVHFTDGQPYLRLLPIVLAAAILLAFVNEMMRRDGRERLVESVTGTVAGVAVALAVAGWVATGREAGGENLVVAGALALAVGSAVVAVHLPPWISALVTAAVSAGAGALAGVLLPDVAVSAGALLGLAIGVLVAALHTLFDKLPSLHRRIPPLAAVTLPVMVTGFVVYVVERVLVG